MKRLGWKLRLIEDEESSQQTPLSCWWYTRLGSWLTQLPRKRGREGSPDSLVSEKKGMTRLRLRLPDAARAKSLARLIGRNNVGPACYK